MFCQRRASEDSLAAKRKRNRAIMVSKPRRATAKWLHKLSRQVRVLTAQGLERFANEDALLDYGFLPDGRQRPGGLAQDEKELLQKVALPRCLTVAIDQEQLQMTAMMYCEDVLRLTVVRLHDFFHRVNNDLKEAVARSGLYSVYLACVAIFNMAYGPFQSCAWFHLMLQQAADLGSALKPDDSLLLHFWPGILRDRGLHLERGDGVVGREGRKAYIEGMRGRKILDIKNVKCSPSTWMSFNHAHAAWDAHLSERAMVLTAVCMNKGWITCVEDLSAPTAAGSSIGFQPEKSKAAAVKSAKNALAALKSKCQSNLSAALRLLVDPDVINGSRIIALATRPTYSFFTKAESVDLKGAARTVAFLGDLCEHGAVPVMRATLKTRDDMAALSRCGFRTSYTGASIAGLTARSPEVVDQDRLAACMSLLVENLVSTTAGSMTFYTEAYPCKLIGLLREETATATMAAFHEDLLGYWEAKDTQGGRVLVQPILCPRTNLN